MMQTRRLGRTGHYSTLAILGTAAFGHVTQKEADLAMEGAIAAGVNHIDVAPSYGDAEKRLAPWMPRERDRFFLGCKTTERSKKNAAEEFQRSLGRLGVDHFDLYQFHAVTRFEELDEIFARGGALEAVLEARDAGLVKYIGITGHGIDAPAIYLEALRRFDFDTVLFPINFVLYANPAYRKNAEELLRQCRIKDVGTMIIKSVARGPWGDHPRQQATWYQPFTDIEHIQTAVNFALSQDITGLCTAGDVGVLPLFLQACEQFNPLSQPAQEALIATADQFEPLFI
jgi:aryl-alcohol dehydrogenase-like predicted oxidoreductase